MWVQQQGSRGGRRELILEKLEERSWAESSVMIGVGKYWYVPLGLCWDHSLGPLPHHNPHHLHHPLPPHPHHLPAKTTLQYWLIETGHRRQAPTDYSFKVG